MSSGPDDPFAGVSREVAAGHSAEANIPAAPQARGEWISPVPDDAPQPRSRHKAKGPVAASWAYRDEQGRVQFWACRFDAPDGSKDVLLQTLWRDGKRMEWRWKYPPCQRPLFGLDALVAAPAAPALVVEGEKTADATAGLFPAFAVVTWPGGSKAVGKADWTPLAGRRVVILPDADEPGLEAAQAVAAAAMKARAEGAAIVELPDGLADGWDAADQFPTDFSRSDLSDLIGAALASASMGQVQLPYGYRLDASGLYFEERKQDSVHDLRLSDGFEVLGLARDSEGGGWAVLIRFRDLDGRTKQVIVARARLATEASTVRAELADAGLFIHPGRGKAERFAAFLAEVAHSCRWTLAERTGWVDRHRFALPGEVIAGAAAEPVYFTGNNGALHYRQAGTLDGWRNGIASRAIGNRLLVFALSLGFAGPLMRLVGLEGGGFHFRGPSSSGKTSLAKAAGSIWGGGGPLGFGASWRATANALEGVAFGHSETLLILDELALVDPAEAGGAAYALATGQGKARARQDGALRKRSEWKVLVLSTGEIGLADHMQSGRRPERTMAGQELRLVDLSADIGAGMGAFEQLHGSEGPAQFSDAIRAAADSDFGHAGPIFVKRLIAAGDAGAGRARQLVADFMATARHDGDSGQIHRAALRFAAVAAAGEVAIALKVVPWPAGTARAAALALFDRWAQGFGRTGLREERQVIVAVRDAIQQNLARFGQVPHDRMGMDDEAPGAPRPREGESRALSSLGYTHEINFEPVYMFHNAGWSEVLKGVDRRDAAKILEASGFLWPDSGRQNKKVRVSGKLQSFYVIRASILEFDEETGALATGEGSQPPSRAEPESGDPFDDDTQLGDW